jgi:5'-nucleotidase
MVAGVMFIMLTNDDGIDSPALVPFARALQGLGDVGVVAPAGERSWIAKAITRHQEVHVEVVERDGLEVHAVSGFPADCTQLGVHALFGRRPDLVVSGINIGYNHGAAFMLSSGTIGAAIEGWISGVPSIAVSAGTVGDWDQWSEWIRSQAADEAWSRLAEVAAGLVGAVAAAYPSGADVISINLPSDADTTTERRITTLGRVGYDRLFSSNGGGVYGHRFGGLRWMGGVDGTDIEAAREGAISITPIRLPGTDPVPGSVKEALGAACAAEPLQTFGTE